MGEKNELRNNNGEIVLVKNNITAFCYRTAPAVIPSQFGQPQITRVPCGNSCPAFKITMNDGKVFANVCCGSAPVQYLIEQPQNTEQDADGKLIQMP